MVDWLVRAKIALGADRHLIRVWDDISHQVGQPEVILTQV